MGIQDRRYHERGGDYGEGGGFKRAWRRMFVEGDDFFSWSVPFFTVPRGFPGLGGIQVRIHLLFIVFAAAQLIWPIQRNAVGFAFAAFSMFTLWTLVLLHEFGHCLACRKVGGEADRVLLWPLGGLASCRPPHNWKASLITTLGGPAVNFFFIPIIGGAMLALGAGWGTVIFNPLDPISVLGEPWLAYNTAYWRHFLWSAYYMNLVLFLFNMAVVMFPMDAGRVVQELLWWRLGYKRSMVIALNLGIVVAIAMAAFALATQKNLLLGVAIFGGITCFQQRRTLAFMQEDAPWAYDTDRGYKGFGGSPVRGGGVGGGSEQDRRYQAALKKQQKDQELKGEIDRILDKIRNEGMGALSRKEKAILKDETERKRGGA